jgi:hypothetical protein
VLEIYALRCAVEVYFKEAKQHLGFLKEQSIHYAAYIASIHLVFSMVSITKVTASPSSSFNSFNAPLMIALKTCQRHAA